MKSFTFIFSMSLVAVRLHAANEALQIAIRPASEAGALNVTSPACPGDVFDFRTCEGVVVGAEDLGLFQVKLPSSFGDGNKSWKRNGNTWSYTWAYPQGITVHVSVQPDGDSLKLAYTLTNTSSNAMDSVQLHTCLPTTEAPGFFPSSQIGNAQTNWAELYDRLHVWSGGQSLAFSKTRLAKDEVHLALMRQGAAPVRWGWWTNGPETFDQPLIALASLDGRHTVALAFEQAIWASSNVGDNRACFHLFPWFGRIEPGKNAMVKGRLYVIEGGPREAATRYRRDFHAEGARDAAFQQADTNALCASEAFQRCRRYLDAWLTHADPATGLIPRNLTGSGNYWNGRDSAADNYPYMVLTAALIDRPLMQGRLLEMLRTEQRLTARVDRLTDDYSFSKKGWRRETFDLDETLFDSAEYVKDGLIPLTEWLGSSPWSDRMTGLIDDIWKNARQETPFGPIPTFNFEVNGDLLQSGARLYWFTGDRKYLDWSVRLGDYYLLGTNHPTRNRKELRLRDHGCEVVNGLTELYLALQHSRPEKAAQYRKPMHEMFDRILEAGRNEYGMLYDEFNPQTGAHSQSLCDTWGYNYDGVYTMYLLDGTTAYRDATRLALGNLQAHYRNYPWEGASADGYADSIESAINLYNREPIASTSAWIDSEIRVMWAKQKPDGIIEGWHGDGNFARTSIMYALWKTQGLHVEPWRADVRLGAVKEGETLLVSLSADQPWEGRLVFDRPRHRQNLHMPMDYPRINQFAEWFSASEEARYTIQNQTTKERIQVSGRDLQQGSPVALQPGVQTRWLVEAAKESPILSIDTSNKKLEKSFHWAAGKALSYVQTGKSGVVDAHEGNRQGGGPVTYIPSYWAGYTWRSAFYSRDFCHQAAGAHLLGLQEENRSMLRAFAASANASRKWYPLWALNFDGTPFKLDYGGDTSFVREVPAVFELVEQCYRQYLWTGNPAFAKDPVLWNFCTKAVTEFITSHDTRIPNGVAEGDGSGDIFRGTATYNEIQAPLIEAGDGIACQYQALLAYARLLAARGEKAEAAAYEKKAAQLRTFFNTQWGVKQGAGSYVRGYDVRGQILADFGRENSWFMPMKFITEPSPKTDAYLDFIAREVDSPKGRPSNLEAISYLPGVFFPYNRVEEGWKWLEYIMDQPNKEYPEISYTLISHVVEGLMGLEPNAPENAFLTVPRLPHAVARAGVRNIPLGRHRIDVIHESASKSLAVHQSGQGPLKWQACFYGDHPIVAVNGTEKTAETMLIHGVRASSVFIELLPGQSATAELLPGSLKR